MRGLGTHETRSSDSLNMLMFQPDYIHRLLELLEGDAEARGAEIETFIGGDCPAAGSQGSL